MKFRMLSLVAAIMFIFSVSVAAKTEVSSSGGIGNVFVGAEKPENQTEILAVNPGDTITIAVSGATDKITLISYKGSTASADSIQYINQYTQDPGTISYKIRKIDNAQNGLYLLMINDGTNVSSFYYKVGRPVLTHGEDEGVTYYKRVDFGEGNTMPSDKTYINTTSIAYLASFTPAGGTISSYGFNIRKNENSENNNIIFGESDISGEAVFEFGITIYNIKPDKTYTLEEIINGLSVEPYVNYID